MTKVGERIGAIYGTNGKTVQFLGYGVYKGEQNPDGDEKAGIPAAAGQTALLARILGKNTNPLMLLDSGDYVWGCECWWGPEKDIKTRLAAYSKAGYTIETVDMKEERKANG